MSMIASAGSRAAPDFVTIRATMARDSRPDTPKAIGIRLQLLRLAYGVAQGRPKEITQTEFAKLCGISKGTWNNAETGDNRLGLDNALAVCRRTGAGLDYIYRGERSTLPHALAVEIEKLEKTGHIKRA